MYFSGIHAVDQVYANKVQKAYAESTSRNFCSTWTHFMDFYAAHKLPLYPPCPMNVARYITVYSDRVKSYGTVNNTLSSIARFYELSGYKLDLKSPILDLLLKACKRSMSYVSKPKSPIQVAHILLIQNLIDFNDSCQFAFFIALVIQFFSAVRVSNLLPPTVSSIKSVKHIRRSDIFHVDNNLIVTLPWSKTLQNADNVFTIPIAANPGSVLDPVQLFLSFTSRNPCPPNYPVFTYVSGKVYHIMTQSVYIQYLKSFLSRIGVDPASFSSHSVRRGSTSFMFESSVPVNLIKHHGTWRSNAYQRYLSFNHKQQLIPTQYMNEKINSMFGRLALG